MPPPGSTSTTDSPRVADEVNLAGDGTLSVIWPADAAAAAEAGRSIGGSVAVLGAGAGALQPGCAWSSPLGCAAANSWSGSCSSGAGEPAQITGVTLLQAVPSVIFGVLLGIGVAALLVALGASGRGRRRDRRRPPPR